MTKAIYEPTGQECYVNLDFVVDIFPHDNGYIAYTFDNERGGYIISKEDFERDMRGTENERRIRVSI